MPGDRSGRRAPGDLQRGVRRPCPLGSRPRELHVLRRLRRGLPVEAIDFTQSPKLARLRAGAIVAATGCDPAPGELVAHLGYPAETVLTQTEFAPLLDDWEERLWLDQPPVGDVVMIQCAGSRDLRRLPYCSRLCCTIALKHAIRLRTLFPQTRVTVCYLELRTLGAEGESWYTRARLAGVEFLRGSPPRVEFDARQPARRGGRGRRAPG